MSRTAHHDIVAQLGPHGYEAVRGTRDGIRPKPATRGRTVVNIDLGPAPASRPATRAPARDAVATFVGMAEAVRRDLAPLAGQQIAIRDSLARLAPIVEARRAATPAAIAKARDADLSALAHHQGVTAASVNAANAARWPRPGR